MFGDRIRFGLVGFLSGPFGAVKINVPVGERVRITVGDEKDKWRTKWLEDDGEYTIPEGCTATVQNKKTGEKVGIQDWRPRGTTLPHAIVRQDEHLETLNTQRPRIFTAGGMRFTHLEDGD
ncbi:hypothetical protein ACFL2C_00205 [Patescibacteria group bacterium]